MTKPMLTPDQHIAEMNRRLQQHPNFRDGMAFVPYPNGASGRAMSGYSVTGPYGLMGIYAQIAHEVDRQFDLNA